MQCYYTIIHCKSWLTFQVPQVFRALLDSYKNVQDVIISFANKFYANIEFPLKEDFIEEMKTIFDADPENIDCSDSTKAAALINEYVRFNVIL